MAGKESESKKWTDIMAVSYEIRDPPTTTTGILKELGPGLVLTASVVGSGELITTTILGAQIGFVMLWAILISCVIKMFIQVEFGRTAIATGKTSIEAMNDTIPGPKFLGNSWISWLYMIFGITSAFVWAGGMAGSMGSCIGAFTGTDPVLWGIVITLITLAIFYYSRYYDRIKSIIIGIVAIFVFTTVIGVFFTVGTPYAISAEDIASGLTFAIPAGAWFTAFSMFGMTGVGGNELMQYPYWCIEAGYANSTGPREESPEWAERARGWIRVMWWDVFLSTIISLVCTVAFYLLGAAVLHRIGVVPSGMGVAIHLAKMFTEVYGPVALWWFLIGAFFVLFSTWYSFSLGFSRVLINFIQRAGFIRYERDAATKTVFGFLFIYSIWAIAEIVAIKAPAFLIILAGIFINLALIPTGLAACYWAFKQPDKRIAARTIVKILIVITFIVILAFNATLVAKRLGLF